jgi:glycine dehydrogenase
MDGANLNALVGLAAAGQVRRRRVHLNLHKTFCIPHGGGGPGVGPVACEGAPGTVHAGPRGHLDRRQRRRPISASRRSAPPACCPSLGLREADGRQGLTEGHQVRAARANYIAKRLNDYFPVLYTGRRRLVAHECILDLRELTAKTASPPRTWPSA